ncbi:hypothetical protein Q6301_26940, partial [Klebsiella quasipneumoniae]
MSKFQRDRLLLFVLTTVRMSMSDSAMSVVILAAGKGTRLYSDLPQV